MRRFKSKVLDCSVPLFWVSIALEVLYLRTTKVHCLQPQLWCGSWPQYVHQYSSLQCITSIQYTTCTVQYS